MIRVTHVAAADDMGTQTPDIPPLGDGRTRSRLNIGGSHLLNRVRHRRVDRERHVDLDRVKTGQIEIKSKPSCSRYSNSRLSFVLSHLAASPMRFSARRRARISASLRFWTTITAISS